MTDMWRKKVYHPFCNLHLPFESFISPNQLPYSTRNFTSHHIPKHPSIPSHYIANPIRLPFRCEWSVAFTPPPYCRVGLPHPHPYYRVGLPHPYPYYRVVLPQPSLYNGVPVGDVGWSVLHRGVPCNLFLSTFTDSPAAWHFCGLESLCSMSTWSV